MTQEVIDTVDYKGAKVDVIRGPKNPSCYPCEWEGCVYGCPHHICSAYAGSIYLREHKEEKKK